MHPMAWTHVNILSNYFVYLGNKDMSCIFKAATKSVLLPTTCIYFIYPFFLFKEYVIHNTC